MFNISFSPWPNFTSKEADAVQKILLSNKVNYWTGEQGRFFEKEYAAYINRKYAIALANGTVALELALYILGVGKGDEVITTSRTFIASASAAVMRGAIPVLADVDPISQNITAESIKAVITPKTKAIICVHLAGWPCDMDSIVALAKEHGLYIIEDCAQAHGARYKGRPVGSFGEVAAFSFCQDKIITTGGEGGLIALDDEGLWRKGWAYKDHGKSWEAVYERQHPPGFRWLHESFGTNWRMLEMQAVIGRMQLEKLDGWVDRRRENAALLTEGFANILGLRVTTPPVDFYHAYYKYYVFVEPEKLASGWDRDRVMNEIVNRGVPCYSGSCSEIYLEKAFVDCGYGPKERLSVARELGETSLMFLVHPTLGEKEMGMVCDVVADVMRKACGIE